MKHVEHDLYKKKIYISPNGVIRSNFNEQSIGSFKYCELMPNKKYRVIVSNEAYCTILSEEQNCTVTLNSSLETILKDRQWANTTSSGVEVG